MSKLHFDTCAVLTEDVIGGDLSDTCKVSDSLSITVCVNTFTFGLRRASRPARDDRRAAWRSGHRKGVL